MLLIWSLLGLVAAEDLELQRAVRDGDAAAVRRLRQQLPAPEGYSYDAEDGFGRSPLHEAVEFGHLAVVAEILKWPGFEELLNAPDELGWTPLHWSALKGSAPIAQQLLRFGARVDVRENEFACEPLQWAARRGHVPVIRLLLAAGANTSYQDKENRTAADWARTTNRINALKLLEGVEHQEKDDPSQSNLTALHIAAAGNRKDELQRLLATSDGRTMAAQLDAWGRTPLLTMIQSTHLTPGGEESVISLLPLLKDIPEAFAADPDGRSPFHWAVLAGFPQLAEELMHLPGGPDRWGRRPIHLAAAAGHQSLLELLLKRKADILSVDNSRRTPLHLAASMGSGLDQLLAHGAPVDAKDHLDRRPLHYAILLGQSDAATKLIHTGANVAARDVDWFSPLSFAQAAMNSEPSA